jgi:parvulin-like peptidyl-prolyl isomerase
MVEFAGIRLEPDQIVDFLRQEMQLKAVVQQMIRQQCIQLAAQERLLEVTLEEIQAAATQMRYELRLERAADTLNWLAENLMTAEDWEAGLRDRLLTQKLQQALFADEVERMFAHSRLDFEQIDLYQIRVPDQPLAQELVYEIEENEISFYEAAHLYDIDPLRRLRCGYEGRLRRWDLSPEMGALVFGAKVGEVLGPFAIAQGFDLLMVSEFIAAELTPETRQILLDRMFQEWLEGEVNHYIHHQGTGLLIPGHSTVVA